MASTANLDSIFLARSTTKRADVGWRSHGGVDISNRYEKYTSGTKAATTGLRSGGTDLSDLFQNISVPLLSAYLENASYTRRASGSATTAAFQGNSDGSIYGSNPGNLLVVKYAWLLAGTNSQFDIRVTPTSGSFSSGSATSTWLNLGSSHTWNRNTPANSSTSVTFTVEIRDASSLAVLATATVTITADGTP